MPSASTAQPISRTLKFNPANDAIVTVAGGCFWGIERLYRKHYGDKIVDLKVGYCNGKVSEPTYEQVCKGDTQHTEAVQISFDPAVVSYEELYEFLFLIHDPTTLNQQGHNTGIQYRSAIFVNSEEQVAIAKSAIAKQQTKWFPNHKIVTSIEPIENFWDAEEYHQLYLEKNPNGKHCPTHFLRTEPLK
ncbi:unnamed protein product [Kuraishia capsulata CBS 1993]|uniref:peptide-methionine (S)-S-oxide reductase n=1 Tax=Kuraishia capsulata CBS 1993 TaxID=1382522 RepID=W6MLW5_9ASCO|nr:uncharacterized protein KUCA_T00001853001 [Kuraishia capsulata CBS 1993]CDK25882.1 unnamed protein product [Kuraishia capsulata CBS 1993]